MPNFQNDIISKSEEYLPISMISMDKKMDNAVQRQS